MVVLVRRGDGVDAFVGLGAAAVEGMTASAVVAAVPAGMGATDRGATDNGSAAAPRAATAAGSGADSACGSTDDADLGDAAGPMRGADVGASHAMAAPCCPAAEPPVGWDGTSLPAAVAASAWGASGSVVCRMRQGSVFRSAAHSVLLLCCGGVSGVLGSG